MTVGFYIDDFSELCICQITLLQRTCRMAHDRRSYPRITPGLVMSLWNISSMYNIQVYRVILCVIYKFMACLVNVLPGKLYPLTPATDVESMLHIYGVC